MASLASNLSDISEKLASLKENATSNVMKICNRLAPGLGQADTRLVLAEAKPAAVAIVALYQAKDIATRPFMENVSDVITRALTYPYLGYKILAIQALVDRELGAHRVDIKGNARFRTMGSEKDRTIIKDDAAFESVKAAVFKDGSAIDKLCDFTGN